MKDMKPFETLPDHARIEKEKHFWDNKSSDYDRFTEKNLKIHELSLPDKINGDVPEDSSVIDVATGTGIIAMSIAERASQVYAVDLSPGMIEEARKKAELLKTENVEFHVEDAYALPFENDKFNVGVCINALHNMKHPERALSEIRRVLKPGSRLITVIVGFGESFLYKAAMSFYNVFVKLPVFHKLDLNGFVDLLESSGFRVINKEILKYGRFSLPLLYVVAEVVK